MKIKNKKRFTISICIVIAIFLGVIAGIKMALKNNNKNTPHPVVNNTLSTNETEDMIVAEVEEKSKKVDFLANVTTPMYKNTEKNIKIPIIIYHAFATPEPAPEQDIYKLYSTGPRFEENISTMLDDGYTFISLEELYRYNKGELALPEKVCIITIDDGNIGCYTDVFPVLQKYNVPATIFIINDCVGTPNYFSWEQAKEMYDTGLVKLNIHGKSHIDYSNVSKEKLVSDYTTAHAELEEKMGEEILKAMAYPSGKCSENSKAWLKEAGFEVQVLTKYGTVNKSRTLDLTDLGRIRGEQATGTQLLRTITNASV